MQKLSSRLSDHLKAYSALAGIFIVASRADGQAVNVIEYTDVNPDETHDLADPMYQLDVDNDGQTDFILNMGKFTYSFTYSGLPLNLIATSVNVLPATGNSVGGNYSTTSSGGGFAMPFPYQDGDSIDNGLQWQNNSSQLLGGHIAITNKTYGTLFTGSGGSWLGQDESFLALRFTTAGTTYYGWLRLSVDGNAQSYTIHDYAYNTVAEQGLAAGQEELLSIDDLIQPGDITVYAYGKTIHLAVHNPVYNNASVSVVSTAGKIVYSGTLAVNNSEINGNAFARGIYTVYISFGDKMMTKKIALF